jgi:hypothetical protein
MPERSVKSTEKHARSSNCINKNAMFKNIFVVKAKKEGK